MILKRCAWAEGNFEEYIQYHDEEWGVPNHDDKKHFEFLILEGAQAGLSWSTILKKRNGYKQAFADFDYNQVAKYPESMIEELTKDPMIIRNRLKIKSAIQNARAFLKVREEFGSFDQYIWGFVDHKPITNYFEHSSEVPASTEISDKMSKDLKKRGFSFVGTTIMYAYVQAMGLTNDHTVDCFRHQELVAAQ